MKTLITNAVPPGFLAGQPLDIRIYWTERTSSLPQSENISRYDGVSNHNVN